MQLQRSAFFASEFLPVEQPWKQTARWLWQPGRRQGAAGGWGRSQHPVATPQSVVRNLHRHGEVCARPQQLRSPDCCEHCTLSSDSLHRLTCDAVEVLIEVPERAPGMDMFGASSTLSCRRLYTDCQGLVGDGKQEVQLAVPGYNARCRGGSAVQFASRMLCSTLTDRGGI